MEPANNFFATNLKYLRERQKMTQEDLATKLGLTRGKVNALENGHTKAPQPEDYLNVSNYFKISIDSLMRINLTKIGELKLRDLEAGNDVYIKGGNLRVLAITVDKSNTENVEYVPIKAKAGYLTGYNDPEYIATLPRFSIPNLPKQGTYRIFPIGGDSMLPIPDGSNIIAKYVEDWKTLKSDTPCVVIMSSQQDFVFKLLSLQNDGTILLRSLNPEYSPYAVPVDEVRELWKFHAYITTTMPSELTEMGYITKTLTEIKNHLIK